jgi:hypothetical protein
MKYQEVRPLIKSGDLLAWSHRGWRTWKDIKIQLVRFFTQSEYAHVGTAWVVGERVFVIEAVIPVVRIYPLSKLGEFYHIPLNVVWSKKAEAFALKEVGVPYSEWEAFISFFNIKGAESTYECAELCSKIAAIDKVDLGAHYTPTAVVYAALKTNGGILRLIDDNDNN